MQQNKKINKKKTSVKKGEKCPIFNEAMMFSVPAHTLSVRNYLIPQNMVEIMYKIKQFLRVGKTITFLIS